MITFLNQFSAHLTLNLDIDLNFPDTTMPFTCFKSYLIEFKTQMTNQKKKYYTHVLHITTNKYNHKLTSFRVIVGELFTFEIAWQTKIVFFLFFFWNEHRKITSTVNLFENYLSKRVWRAMRPRCNEHRSRNSHTRTTKIM